MNIINEVIPNIRHDNVELFFIEPDSPFLELDQFIHHLCGPYEQSWLTGVYALLRYAPYFITIALYIASFWYKQIYLLFFSFGLTLDGLINEAINDAVNRPPRTPKCPPLWGTAVAYEIETSSFFVTFILGYMTLYRPRTKLWHILLLFIWLALNVSGAHFMHFHHSDAIVNGAILGTFLALTYQVLLHWIFVPSMCRVLRYRLVRYWGYIDTLCNADVVPRHIVIHENFTREFGSNREKQLDYEKVEKFVSKQNW